MVDSKPIGVGQSQSAVPGADLTSDFPLITAYVLHAFGTDSRDIGQSVDTIEGLDL